MYKLEIIRAIHSEDIHSMEAGSELIPVLKSTHGS